MVELAAKLEDGIAMEFARQEGEQFEVSLAHLVLEQVSNSWAFTTVEQVDEDFPDFASDSLRQLDSLF